MGVSFYFQLRLSAKWSKTFSKSLTDTRIMNEDCSMFKLKKSDQLSWHRFDLFNGKLEQNKLIVFVLLLLTWKEGCADENQQTATIKRRCL